MLEPGARIQWSLRQNERESSQYVAYCGPSISSLPGYPFCLLLFFLFFFFFFIVTCSLFLTCYLGVTGLVKGARKGVMSALVKPTVGAIDLITRTSQGARNSAGADTTHHTRSRPPRYFASDKVIITVSS
jgi:hypothetical protein